MSERDAATPTPGFGSGVLVALAIVIAIVFAGGVLLGVFIARGDDRSYQTPTTAQQPPAAAARPASPETPVTAVPEPSAGAAPISFEPPLLDFGILDPGETVTDAVLVHNEGDTPLTIIASRSSCACTAVDLANTVIPPGEAAPLSATFDGSHNFGVKTAVIRVIVAGYDPAEVPVRAEVALAVRTLPSHIRPYDALTGQVLVESIDDRPFRILSVNGDPPSISDFDPERDDPRSSYRLGWDLTEYDPETCTNAAGDPMPRWWYVETDHPDCPVFDLEIRHGCTRAAVPGGGRRWVLSERHIIVGRVRPGEWAEFSISMNWFPNTSPNDTIRSVGSAIDGLRADLVEVAESPTTSEYRVRVTAEPGAEGVFVGDLVFATAAHTAPLRVVGTFEP
jgi:hypothetical protein